MRRSYGRDCCATGIAPDGERFSTVDAYAFYVLRAWQHAHKQTLERWPTLAAYYRRVAQRPAVAAALEAERTPA